MRVKGARAQGRGRTEVGPVPPGARAQEQHQLPVEPASVQGTHGKKWGPRLDVESLSQLTLQGHSTAPVTPAGGVGRGWRMGQGGHGMPAVDRRKEGHGGCGGWEGGGQPI